jgi:hypothetical protein
MPNSIERKSSQLSEQYIQDCFHSYLKSSLTQAKAERLLDVDVLASAEGDLMITGAFHGHQDLLFELQFPRTCAMFIFCSFAKHDEPTLSSASAFFEIKVFSTNGALI